MGTKFLKRIAMHTLRKELRSVHGNVRHLQITLNDKRAQIMSLKEVIEINNGSIDSKVRTIELLRGVINDQADMISAIENGEV
jgi:hypothetical protein